MMGDYRFPKYKQIIPAGKDYVAVEYRDEPDEWGRDFHAEPVVVWVLYENEDGTTGVGGLTLDDMADGYETWDSELFVCYARSEDVEFYFDEYNKLALEKREADQQRRQALLKAKANSN